MNSLLVWNGRSRPASHSVCRPEISDGMRGEWQSVVDLIARIAGVRAALIMRVEDENIEVFVASRTKGSPYTPGGREVLPNSGLYCERVVKTGEMLLVPDAEKSDEWRNNPDMKYGMRCYLGFPIRQPDGRVFGTICMLDDRENHFSRDIREFMEKMRNLIESYLDLLYLSVTDPLTGFYSRAFLDVKAEEELANARREQKPIAAFLLDIDHFKRINDTFGHLEGDRVLQNFARAVAESLRSRDSAFRYGGDEIVVLLPDTALEKAVAEAEKLCANVENSAIRPGLRVTASIGAAQWVPGESMDRWFLRADQVLYRAKKRGRNRVGF